MLYRKLVCILVLVLLLLNGFIEGVPPKKEKGNTKGTIVPKKSVQKKPSQSPHNDQKISQLP